MLIFAIAISSFLEAAPRSAFRSTVEGISIDNAHQIEIEGEGRVLRGAAPGEKIDELVQWGVTRVLIFKNELKDEVSNEIDALIESGIAKRNIHKIDFRWRDLPDAETVCRQVVQGLQILEKAIQKDETVFFHCTVGEDRTGLLAGLFRMRHLGWSKKKAWSDEMCRWGYAEGNPAKPPHVVRSIQGELTPVFAQFADWIEAGSLGELDASICKEAKYTPSKLRCPSRRKR